MVFAIHDSCWKVEKALRLGYGNKEERCAFYFGRISYAHAFLKAAVSIDEFYLVVGIYTRDIADTGCKFFVYS